MKLTDLEIRAVTVGVYDAVVASRRVNDAEVRFAEDVIALREALGIETLPGLVDALEMAASKIPDGGVAKAVTPEFIRAIFAELTPPETDAARDKAENSARRLRRHRQDICAGTGHEL
jgi:hypothetical protein